MLSLLPVGDCLLIDEALRGAAREITAVRHRHLWLGGLRASRGHGRTDQIADR
jgi:hypothetical protein